MSGLVAAQKKYHAHILSENPSINANTPSITPTFCEVLVFVLTVCHCMLRLELVRLTFLGIL